ncbi:hypothetical protein [Neobacillus drentensis]|uniref:hypothetical protein n=1 Tax=Neobacillus drentensis TaxID=220684 RepID=UPI000BF73751|nr:hypothetical protein CN481_16140 [Bacillus sp. AFS006103]
MEKEKIKYDEPNLILVNGIGKNKEEICKAYIELFQSGYTLTAEKIADYLRCSYQHVIETIVPKVKHIRITEMAKMLLLKHFEGEEYASLFYKRILFHENDFKRYIMKNAENIISYKKFFERDFEPVVIEQIKAKLLVSNAKTTGKHLTLESYMQRVLNSFLWRNFKNEPIIIKTLEDSPTTLYSQRDLMEIFRVNFKAEFYRKLESLGINKMKLGNMVRYRKEEVEEEFLAKMYITAFQRLYKLSDGRYIEAIQERALELLG